MAARGGFDAAFSCVKNEIDSALEQGVEALAACGPGGEDRAKQLRTAQTHLHQVHGALQLVGVEGVPRVTQELEGLLAELQRDPGRASTEALEVAGRAFRAVRAYLDDLVASKPHQPLRLMPSYSELLGARKAGPADPADLYFPDLSRRPPQAHRTAPSLHPDEAKRYLREQSARYQRGLLAFLRNDGSGAVEMRGAIEAIELLQTFSAQRPFWWVALGFFDALVHEALPADELTQRAAKRLCKRIEQQIRLLAEGTQNVAERLMREALYFVARSAPVSERVRQVQQSYELAGTLPGAQQGGSALESALGAVRELYAKAKEAWDRFAAGQTDGLAAFSEAARSLSTLAAELGNPALNGLLECISATGDWLARDPARMSEALALEQATALLFCGSALEQFGTLGDEFAQQSRLVCARLTDCREGRLLRTALDIPLLDEMARRAQEALIAQQALAESQAALRSVEEWLDRFFRDPSQRFELTHTAEPLEQLDHALALLGEYRARQALAGCVEKIRGFSASDFVPREPEFARDCEQVAQTLSGLGFYFDALGRGSADFDEAMRPVVQLDEARATVEAGLAEKRAQTHDGRSEALRRGESVLPAVEPAVAKETSEVGSAPDFYPPEEPGQGQAFVEIGGQRITATVFTLFSGEARMHLSALKEEHETLKAHGIITDAMLRAVHTLAGIAGTVQLGSLRALALALERALSSLALGPLSCDEETIIEQATEAMDEMVMQALELVEPVAAPELVEHLEQLASAAALTAPAGQPPQRVLVPEEEADLHRESVAPAASAFAPIPPPLAAEETKAPTREESPVRDEVDERLLPAFIEEARESLREIALLLRQWGAGAGGAESTQALKRLLHTLKGSARMAGAMALGELTHEMETRIAGAPSVPFDELESFQDRMQLAIEQLQSQAREPRGEAAPDAAAMLHVRAEFIDRLVDEAGEFSVARSRMEHEVGSLRGTVLELTDNWARLRTLLREMGNQADSQLHSRREEAQASHRDFDPLERDRFTRFQELARMMAESVNDVQTVHQNLMRAMDAAEASLASQARLTRDLQQGLMRVRLLPFESLAARLHAGVRQAARELEKEARLEIRGGQVLLERSVLERMIAPLEHMLRNAVTHGIESPQARAEAGKPATGEIRLEVSQVSNEVLVALSDDGAGLDIERIGARARELGVSGVQEGCLPAEIAELIFVPGLSTAPEVSESAGRGVGMDVVKAAVASLGGRIELSFQSGRGTRFAIHLPLTLAVTQA